MPEFLIIGKNKRVIPPDVRARGKDAVTKWAEGLDDKRPAKLDKPAVKPSKGTEQ